MLSRLSKRRSKPGKTPPRASIAVLREENERLKQRVHELEKQQQQQQQREKDDQGGMLQDAWSVLSEAVASGRQQVADRVMNVLELPTLQKLLQGDKSKDNQDEGDNDPAYEDDMVLSSRDLSARMHSFQVYVDRFENVPQWSDSSNSLLAGNYLLTATVHNNTGTKKSKNVATKAYPLENGTVVVDEKLDLGTVSVDSTVTFCLKTQFLGDRLTAQLKELGLDSKRRFVVGQASVRVQDLIEQSVMMDASTHFAGAELWIKDPETDIVVFENSTFQHPTKILISMDTSKLADHDFPLPHTMAAAAEEEEASVLAEQQYAKHVLVVTRGTRGDVQPFIALARGLAETQNYLVTICTEDRYRPLVERYSDVGNGAIQFRTSGGDTEKRITTSLAKWAMSQDSTVLQMVMLGHSEREFFDSEPAFFYWCRTMRPDLIMFGFTTANIALCISEALQIPMVGFLLQPTVIPSKQYPAIARIDTDTNADRSHRLQGRIKLFLENNPLDSAAGISTMRARRGLQPFSHRVDDLQIIVDQNIPVVVPINRLAFGGKPKDWHSKAVLTDFIFLRAGAVPNLKPRFVKMIMEARAANEPLVVMAFSSMPVARARILELAILMIEQCKRSPRVIALVGNQKMAPSAQDLEAMTDKQKAIEAAAFFLGKDNKLLIDAGAPFGKLFPQVDCVIAHGGLGTTGEILRAAKPQLTTGVLILDQRFWGRRVHELGVGPPPVHVKHLHKSIVKDVDDCLAPESAYAAKAAEVAAKLAADLPADGSESDGVMENVQAILQLTKGAKPPNVHRESITGSPGRMASAMAADVESIVRKDVDIVRGHITSMVAPNLRIRQRFATWSSETAE